MDKTKQDKWKALATIKHFDLVQHWAKRWKNLRNYYKKFKRRCEALPGIIGKRNKKWKFAGQMIFLDDYELIKLKKSNKTNRKSNAPQMTEANCDNDTEKVLKCLRRDNFKKTKSCDICHLFKSYENFLKYLPVRMQRSFKFDMAATFAKYQSRLLKSYGTIISSLKPDAQNRPIYTSKLSLISSSPEMLQALNGPGLLLQDNKMLLDFLP